MDGERKKRPEKRVGVHLENQDHQKIENGIEKKKERERVKTETRAARTLREKGTERETGTGRTVSGGLGSMLLGTVDGVLLGSSCTLSCVPGCS